MSGPASKNIQGLFHNDKMTYNMNSDWSNLQNASTVHKIWQIASKKKSRQLLVLENVYREPAVWSK